VSEIFLPNFIKNLLIYIQVTIDNVGDVFYRFSVYFNTMFHLIWFPCITASWTEINIWSLVRWQFRIERRSTLERLWCNAIYGWTRFKFRFDQGSKL